MDTEFSYIEGLNDLAIFEEDFFIQEGIKSNPWVALVSLAIGVFSPRITILVEAVQK